MFYRFPLHYQRYFTRKTNFSLIVKKILRIIVQKYRIIQIYKNITCYLTLIILLICKYIIWIEYRGTNRSTSPRSLGRGRQIIK